MLRSPIVAVLAMSLAVTLARAQDAPDRKLEAEALFEQGTTAYQQGAHERAALLFERAHQLAPHGATILNAARAREAAGNRPRAADGYAEALRLGGLEDEYRELAESHLAELERALGLIRVEEPKNGVVSVAHVRRAPVPAAVHLEPGRHRVTVERGDGVRAARDVTAVAGGTERLRLAWPASPPRKPATDEGPDGKLVAGAILLGVGVLGAGAATGFGVAALGARDDYEASNRRDRGAADTAETLRTATNAAWIGAGALAVGGAVLMVLALTDSPPPRVGSAKLPGPPLASWRF